jgi:hypothetical protein
MISPAKLPNSKEHAGGDWFWIVLHGDFSRFRFTLTRYWSSNWNCRWGAPC